MLLPLKDYNTTLTLLFIYVTMSSLTVTQHYYTPRWTNVLRLSPCTARSSPAGCCGGRRVAVSAGDAVDWYPRSWVLVELTVSGWLITVFPPGQWELLNSRVLLSSQPTPLICPDSPPSIFMLAVVVSCWLADPLLTGLSPLSSQTLVYISRPPASSALATAGTKIFFSCDNTTHRETPPKEKSVHVRKILKTSFILRMSYKMCYSI